MQRRLQFCDKKTQLKYCEQQFELVRRSGLPVFLHCRAAADDMAAILQRNTSGLRGGVVHSFDGTLLEVEAILQHPGLCIGTPSRFFQQHTVRPCPCTVQQLTGVITFESLES